jgi:hypothetical protein
MTINEMALGINNTVHKLQGTIEPSVFKKISMRCLNDSYTQQNDPQNKRHSAFHNLVCLYAECSIFYCYTVCRYAECRGIYKDGISHNFL